MIDVNLKEGTLFAVPLLGGGFLVGLIVRKKKKSQVPFGYFFPHRFDQPPLEEELQELNASQAIAVMKFAELGFVREEWPLLGTLHTFDRSNWPFPRFGRVPKINPNSAAWIIKYDDDDTSRMVREYDSTPEIASQYPPDEMPGHKAAEMELSDLVDEYEANGAERARAKIELVLREAVVR